MLTRCSLLATAAVVLPALSTAEHLREPSARLRNFDQDNAASLAQQQQRITAALPGYTDFFHAFMDDPVAALQQLTQVQAQIDTDIETEKHEMDAFLAAFRKVGMSIDTSDPPSDVPTLSPMLSMVPGEPVTPSPTPSVNLTTPDPTASPTADPTPNRPCGLSAASRVDLILAELDAVANPADIRNANLPQGQATKWLLDDDAYYVCPDDPKMLQRWVLAVIYFSTNGDAWFQCSANPAATDDCGNFEPFTQGEERFLAPTNECEWAGISCINKCVTEIEFEENNLVGTIATEIGLLSMLAIWGMERGGLTGQIPTEIAKLTSLIFLDLDFNELTGTLSSELLSLSSLTQLDINDNNMSGSINGIGVYPDMEFMQLHNNDFSGTVPDAVGTYTNLAAFTLHGTDISGVMPSSVCDLIKSHDNGGVLTTLIADCSLPNPDIVCECCTDCRRG